MELTDLSAAGRAAHPIVQRLREQYSALVGVEEASDEHLRQGLIYESHRTIGHDPKRSGSGSIVAYSISQIENKLTQLKETHDSLVVLPNLTPIDTYIYADKMDSARAKLQPGIVNFGDIVERVRSDVYRVLIDTEEEIESGKPLSSVFDRAQQYINASLQTIAPDALSKFVAAQERISSNETEALEHALTSCRRMIKSLADALYPADDRAVTGVDNVVRVMSDDKYKNRLLEYVRREVGQHKNGKVLSSIIADLGSRLNALDSLASKGVHNDVSASEAETCVVWTYLLAGDLVRIADGTSIYLLDESADA